jgi:KaiC/GvpD/RAD55 family RecA-like ATPase
MKKSIIVSPSPAGVQMKAQTRHAGLLSIKAANEWIQDSLKRPDPKMYFNNLIVQYENTVIFAASNVGKSILATQIAEDISKSEKVLYVDLELSSKQFQMRYTDSSTRKVHQFPANFKRAEIDPEFMVGAHLEQETLDSIEEAARQGTRFFVIDNLTFICQGTESGAKAGLFMKQLIRLKKKYGLTTIVIAHTPKRRGWKPITQNDLAGSSKLINFFDAGIALARSANDTNLRYLKQVKVRTGEFQYDEDNVLLMDVNKDDGFLKFDVLGTGREEDHLNALEGGEMADELISILKMQKEGMTVREIAEVMNIGKSSVQRRIEAARQSHITIPEDKNDAAPVPGQEGRPAMRDKTSRKKRTTLNIN